MVTEAFFDCYVKPLPGWASSALEAIRQSPRSASRPWGFGGALARMPSSTLIPLLGGFRFPYKSQQKRAPFLTLGYWAA